MGDAFNEKNPESMVSYAHKEPARPRPWLPGADLCSKALIQLHLKVLVTMKMIKVTLSPCSPNAKKQTQMRQK
jgi:hypothetical protein